MKPVHIIGGGLAGLSLGIALLRKEVPVRLDEAGAYPRHRVCGEFITGVSPRVLDSLGVAADLEDAERLREVRWFEGQRKAGGLRLEQPAWGLSRWELDRRLAGRLRSAGGELREHSRVRGDAFGEGQVRANGRQVTSRKSRTWLGLKIHLRGVRLKGDLEVHLGPAGYAGLSRIEGGRANLCGLFRQRTDCRGKGMSLLRQYLQCNRLDALAARLQASESDASSFSAVSGMDYGLLSTPAPGISIGDQAGLIPPFTGNGMSMAFESAHLAVDPLKQWSAGLHSWEETVRLYRSRLRRQILPRVVRARILHPFLMAGPFRKSLAGLARKGLLPFRELYKLTH